MQRIEREEVVISSDDDARISTAGVIIADSTSSTEASSRVEARSGHIFERGTGQVLVPRLRDHDVVLDADSAVPAERVHLFPVDVLRILRLLQVAEERVDEVEAGLD